MRRLNNETGGSLKWAWDVGPSEWRWRMGFWGGVRGGGREAPAAGGVAAKSSRGTLRLRRRYAMSERRGRRGKFGDAIEKKKGIFSRGH